MSDDLLIDHEEGVSTLTVNRPLLNLMTLSLLQEIVARLEFLAARDETRCVVIGGAGARAFLGQLAAALGERLLELDINPLLVRERGRGVTAVDARAVTGVP